MAEIIPKEPGQVMLPRDYEREENILKMFLESTRKSYAYSLQKRSKLIIQ